MTVFTICLWRLRYFYILIRKLFSSRLEISKPMRNVSLRNHHVPWVTHRTFLLGKLTTGNEELSRAVTVPWHMHHFPVASSGVCDTQIRLGCYTNTYLLFFMFMKIHIQSKIHLRTSYMLFNLDEEPIVFILV